MHSYVLLFLCLYYFMFRALADIVVSLRLDPWSWPGMTASRALVGFSGCLLVTQTEEHKVLSFVSFKNTVLCTYKLCLYDECLAETAWACSCKSCLMFIIIHSYVLLFLCLYYFMFRAFADIVLSLRLDPWSWPGMTCRRQLGFVSLLSVILCRGGLR